MHLRKIIKKVKSYNEKADFELIEKAFKFAGEVHKDEKRASGEPYVQHLLETAFILAELKQDSKSIAAALLHDVLETAKVTLEDLKEIFDDELSMLVDGVTKISKIRYHDREERDAESIRKMFLATTKDIRVLIIKLADKLHNMRTLGYLSEEKQRRISQATLDIYAPLAYRLGMASIKWELEDIAFKYLHPTLYAKFRQKFGKKRIQREIEILMINRTIEKEMKKHKIPVKITGRPKHFYSIYRKMIEKHRTFEELYDLTALRILTEEVKHCYEILGIIHILWKPIPGEFDDYIAMPKSNMYQSLHTAVIGPSGQPVEIQIRTEEMHKIAEEGIAAHWRYKGTATDQKFDKKLSWLKQILDWQRDSETAKDFMDFLKIDFFQDEIHVFTPKGRVIELPKGSTPIDFAYGIHSKVGDTCTGSIVNGRIVPLRYKLKNGDIVNILTSKNQKPKKDWLKIVKTTKAKTKIRGYFRKKKIPVIRNVKSIEKLKTEDESMITIPKLNNPKIKLANCCKPLPGNKIIGFLSFPDKVILHKKDCKNLARSKKIRLKAEWKQDYNKLLNMRVIAEDRVGLFADILNTVAATGTNINEAKGKMISDKLVEVRFRITPENLEHIVDVIKRVKKIQNIRNVAIDNE